MPTETNPNLPIRPIRTDETLSPQQQREVKAAMTRLGLSQKEAAREYQLSYDNLRKMTSGQLVVWTDYARAFRDLISRADLT